MLELLPAAPKAELHLHLRGAMPPSFFAELVERRPPERALADAPARHRELFENNRHLRPLLTASSGGETAAQAGAASLYDFQTFEQFLASYLFTSYFFRTQDDFRRLIQAVRAELARQNIVYAEITVSLMEYMQRGTSLRELVEAMEEEAAGGEPRTRWIVDLVRDFPAGATLAMLREIIAMATASICGITLGGSEHRFPPALFKEHYRLARDHGLRLTVHAGEGRGPESIWEAIRELEVDRIGHGVRAIEDPRLVEYLAGHGTPLEICPTSNLRTGVYSSYEEHPVRELHLAGVPVSIHTDDPAFFGTTLTGEFTQLAKLGMADADLREILENGFRHAFLSPGEADSYLARLRKFLSAS